MIRIITDVFYSTHPLMVRNILMTVIIVNSSRVMCPISVESQAAEKREVSEELSVEWPFSKF